MIFDYPAARQIPALRRLWKEAFGDEDRFLDAFFETAFSPSRCRCITEEGELVAALYWFEMRCAESRLAYLYAVATAEAQRGKGLFSALLQDTKTLLTLQGFDGILLVPQTEALGQMYEKFGFSPCTRVREFAADAGEQPVDFREIGVAAFARLRRQLLPADSVLQEGEDIRFLGSQCHFWAGEDWLAAGQICDDKLICTEYLGNDGAIPGLLRALSVPRGHFRMPGDERPFGYLLPLQAHCRRPGYFGLALD